MKKIYELIKTARECVLMQLRQAWHSSPATHAGMARVSIRTQLPYNNNNYYYHYYYYNNNTIEIIFI